MGSALAAEAVARGYETTVVSGPVNINLPDRVKILPIRTAREMIETSLNELRNDYSIFISTAAIADYSPDPLEGKIKSNTPDLDIKLRLNPKLTKQVKENFPRMLVVAFKAEYNIPENRLIESARLKLKEENLDLVIANDLGKTGFGSDSIEVYITTREEKITYMPLNSKDNIARDIWGIIEGKRKDGEPKQ